MATYVSVYIITHIRLDVIGAKNLYSDQQKP